MKVLAHPDPNRLESALLERIAGFRERDPFSRVLVLVPTLRLGRHVQRRLASHMEACLGVDILHHGALVRRVLDGVSGIPARPGSPRVLGALLARVLEEIPDNPWARFVRDRPGALPGFFQAVTDLREARLTADQVSRALGSGPDRALSEVYRAYVAALEAARARGLTDPAGLVEEALPHASSHARRYALCLHHGAYELIGTHLALLEAVSAACETVFLVPVEPDARVTGYAERFVRRHLVRPGLEAGVDAEPELLRLPDAPGGGSLGSTLARLYDEEARPKPAPEGAVHLRHVQGVRGEVEGAVHSALAAVARGTGPVEIAVIGRSLQPYAAALERSLGVPGDPGDGSAGIAWNSSLDGPLRREPAIRELLLLLRVVAEDFPRGPTAELLRSPALRWRALGLPGPPPSDPVEAWSREAGIVSGLEEWRVDLPGWAGQWRPGGTPRGSGDDLERARRIEGRRGAARRIADAVEAVAGKVPATPRRWSGHARRIEELFRDLWPVPEGDRVERTSTILQGLLDEMRQLELVVGDRRRVSFRQMVDWLEQAVDGAPLPLHPEDEGGLRVLDILQARGLTFDRVIWMGFQSGSFPRPAREDPFLPDRARRALQAETGCALPLGSESDGEERLLLALMLGMAREGTEISWQRSDDAGRPRSASMALREVARVVLGRPSAADLVEERAERIRAHPRDQLDDLRRGTGVLSPGEDLLRLALDGGANTGAREELQRRCPEMVPGLRMLDATESLAPRDPVYDGRIGTVRAAPAPTLSVSAVQQLGRCPLQFFFDRLLRIRPLPEEVGPFEIVAREMGLRVHRILESIYQDLKEEGAFSLPGPENTLERALALFEGAWAAETVDLRERFQRRAPILWSVEESRWCDAIRSFLHRDLTRLRAAGAVPDGLEVDSENRVALGKGVELGIHGRLDRTLRVASELEVGDYKTRGNLQTPVGLSNMLRGENLQVPLYHLLCGGPVELLGVGPEYEEGGVRSGEEKRLARFDGFWEVEQQDGMLETLRILEDLRRTGKFPLRRDDHRCSWCDFRRACRRNHPPTIHREEVAVDTADFYRLREKSTMGKAYLLDPPPGEPGE